MSFPAKLLLFGEYTLMHGSMALAVPFRQFAGEWACSVNQSTHSGLENFMKYLQSFDSHLNFNADIEAFKNDIVKGLFFESDIPVGYGLGSSGALCAAFYERYAVTPVPRNSSDMMLPVLRSHLSVLESYFHGTSSGMDPLVCYTDAPVLLETNGIIKRQKNLVSKHMAIFLLDTGIPGETGKNVKLFHEMMKNDKYSSTIKNELTPLVNNSIQGFIDGEDIFQSIRIISEFQQEMFNPMIPEEFQKYFRQQNEQFILKLCGSGGGGYLLGFSKDIRSTAGFFKSENLNLIEVTL